MLRRVRRMNRLTKTGCEFLAPMQATKEQLCEEIKRHQKYYDKLAEYEDLEEQGLMLKLPCKVGDTLYKTPPVNSISEWVVYAINIGLRKDGGSLVVLAKNKRGAMVNFEIDEFGKTVFLTMSEAEESESEEH